MKLLYCIPSLYNPGGMERIITDKINSLVKDYKYKVTLVTTDQMGRGIFFNLDENIDVIHLDLDFNSTYGLPLLKKRARVKELSAVYKNKLENIIKVKQIEICISTGGKELEFLQNLVGDCKKIFESHFSKAHRKQFAVSRKPGIKSEVLGWIRTQQLISQTKKLDQVVVLTETDLLSWRKSHDNITQIYNFCSFQSESTPDYKKQRAIAVGRLDAQKGFDMLIDSWALNKNKLVNWQLDIYGQGEWEQMLKEKIHVNNLEQNIRLKGITTNIKAELQDSSLFLFSSRYEGFGLAIIEAMTVGLPVISFDCPQGPGELVEKDNGFLVELGNLQEFSNAIISLTSNYELREKMGHAARVSANKFSKTHIMNEWDFLFKNLRKKN
jgi:glycosyltransferase involved in cell wall biosynthesis